jgi:hypothetical protein
MQKFSAICLCPTQRKKSPKSTKKIIKCAIFSLSLLSAFYPICAYTAQPARVDCPFTGKEDTVVLLLENGEKVACGAPGLTEITQGSVNFARPNGSKVKAVFIPPTVTSIGDDCFCNYAFLEIIFLGENSQLTHIGKSAFSGCTCLQKLTFPHNLQTIEHCAFMNCATLESIIIPKSVQNIGTIAFAKCTNLQRVIFEDDSAVKTIQQGTFAMCPSLSSCVLPQQLQNICQSAFLQCSRLTSVEVPQGAHIDEMAFPTTTAVHRRGCTEAVQQTEEQMANNARRQAEDAARIAQEEENRRRQEEEARRVQEEEALALAANQALQNQPAPHWLSWETGLITIGIVTALCCSAAYIFWKSRQATLPQFVK